MPFNWLEQPLDTQPGRARAFNNNAPNPLPSAGSLLVTVDGIDVHENDFIRPDVHRLYSTTDGTNTGNVSFPFWTQLIVTAYNASTQRIACEDYVDGQAYQLRASELAGINILPAGTLPPLIRLNGRAPR